MQNPIKTCLINTFSATILNNHFFLEFMYIPKRYGQSKIDLCPFCEKAATAKNSQDVPVCQAHKKMLLPDLKCSCNSYLDLKKGKFGVYFNCMNCGNMNIKKALSLNPNFRVNTNVPVNEAIGKTVNKPLKQDKKEITITSDEVDINYS